jgi:hypothetical protein
VKESQNQLRAPFRKSKAAAGSTNPVPSGNDLKEAGIQSVEYGNWTVEIELGAGHVGEPTFPIVSLSPTCP